jgi:hypothetical protein
MARWSSCERSPRPSWAQRQASSRRARLRTPGRDSAGSGHRCPLLARNGTGRPAASGCAVLAAKLFEHEGEYGRLHAVDTTVAAKTRRSGGAAVKLAALPRHRRGRSERAEEGRLRMTASIDVGYPRAAYLREPDSRKGKIPVSASAVGFLDGREPGLAPRAEHPPLAAAVVIYGPPPTLRLRLNAGCAVLGHSAADDSWDVAAAPGSSTSTQHSTVPWGTTYLAAKHRCFNGTTPECSALVAAIQAVRCHLPSRRTEQTARMLWAKNTQAKAASQRERA